MITKLPYGLRNGQLVSIEDVEQGLSCNCYCPSCGHKLIARKGNIRDHHFAHYQTQECKSALETALHLAAKEIILEERKFTIPPIYCRIEEIDKDEHQLSPAKVLEIEEVKLEHRIGDIIPDVIAVVKGKELLIEMAVTHFVDCEKEQKIKASGLSTVEVDLSNLKDGFQRNELKRLLLEESSNKKWIYNAKLPQLRKKFIDNFHRKEHLEREEELRQKKKKCLARHLGYDIISIGDYGKVCCPKILKDSAQKLKVNFVTQLLKFGKYWNGIMYGNSRKYIFIDGEKKEIFPSDREYNLTKEQHAERKKIYGQLSNLQDQALHEYHNCEVCPYFDGFLDFNNETLSCRYRKENKLK